MMSGMRNNNNNGQQHDDHNDDNDDDPHDDDPHDDDDEEEDEEEEDEDDEDSVHDDNNNNHSNSRISGRQKQQRQQSSQQSPSPSAYQRHSSRTTTPSSTPGSTTSSSTSRTRTATSANAMILPLSSATLSSDQHRLPPEIAAAYRDAKARGLPDGWICTIDKRHRRKWTAPNNGRSCDSIPKAIGISIEMGLLPQSYRIHAHHPNHQSRTTSSTSSSTSAATNTASSSSPTTTATGGTSSLASNTNVANVAATTANSNIAGGGHNKNKTTSMQTTAAAAAAAATSSSSSSFAAAKKSSIGGRSDEAFIATSATAVTATAMKSTTADSQPDVSSSVVPMKRKRGRPPSAKTKKRLKLLERQQQQQQHHQHISKVSRHSLSQRRNNDDDNSTTVGGEGKSAAAGVVASTVTGVSATNSNKKIPARLKNDSMDEDDGAGGRTVKYQEQGGDDDKNNSDYDGKDEGDDDEYDEEEEEEDTGPPPEPMDPESTLDGHGWHKAELPRTVHWDPDSLDGRKVGWRVRIAFNNHPTSGGGSNSGVASAADAAKKTKKEWVDGRIVRYDPHTHKHKIKFFRENVLHTHPKEDDDDDDDDDDDEDGNNMMMNVVDEDDDDDKNVMGKRKSSSMASTTDAINKKKPGAAAGIGKRGVGVGIGRGRVKKHDDDDDNHPRASTTATKKRMKMKSTATTNKSGKKKTESSVWIWLRNDQHNVQVATRMVWAHVKGYAWWPALVMETNVPEDRKESYVQVEFFSSGEMSRLRDTSDFIRPFSLTTLDPIVAKHKKKRNAKAYEMACREYESIRKTRNDAALFYAGRCIIMANQRSIHAHHHNNTQHSQNNNVQQEQQHSLSVSSSSSGGDNKNNNNISNGYIGKRVQIFRSDINYPYGETLIGKIRKYSHIQKKWLMSFEISSKTKKKYDASWINIKNKESSLMILSDSNSNNSGGRRKQQQPQSRARQQQQQAWQPTDEDLLPYLVGYEDEAEEENDGNKSNKNNNSAAPVADVDAGTQKATVTNSNKASSSAPTSSSSTQLPKKDVAGGIVRGSGGGGASGSASSSSNKILIRRNRNIEIMKLLNERCRGCIEYWKTNDMKLTCVSCNASYHLNCFDPPMSLETLQRMYRDGSIQNLKCSRCLTCRGCYQRDIVFGSHSYPIPTNLCLERQQQQQQSQASGTTNNSNSNNTLQLCSMCKDAYEAKQYCPNCAHTWDDVKYQIVRRQIDWLGRAGGNAVSRRGRRPRGALSAAAAASSSLSSASNDLAANAVAAAKAPHLYIIDSVVPLVFGSFSGDECLPVGAKVDPSFHYPETSEWGYTEVDMLVCDGCEVWVHAGCANVTEMEYEATSRGRHPIYSKEFLCRSCCRKRCEKLINLMRDVDCTSLFAEPVNDKMAPNYRDVIKYPMDLQTMLHKARTQEYWNYSWVREMFELMVLNALTFNRYYTRVWEEAQRFYGVCTKEVFAIHAKAAPPGKYTDDIHRNFDQAEEARRKEEERVQVDESVEKKDLVAGSMMVTSITLPDLRTAPPDQPSCLPFREFKIKSIDAFYFAWMDCCYTCGSSGASDTMLFCVDCGEGFHSFCVSAPVRSMEASSVAGWRCPNCKICEISGDVPQDETRMLFCEMCDRAFSLDLLDPPLNAAPPGLWICGQCVDCTTCGNKLEKKGASLKHWSRYPDRCYRCGGCEGLVDEYSQKRKCNICAGLFRSGDDDILDCTVCKASVHMECDEKAVAAAASGKGNQMKGKTSSAQQKLKSAAEKYVCPACQAPPTPSDEGAAASLLGRRKLLDHAWQVVSEGGMGPHANYSQHELHSKLMDVIDWQARDMWRDEYAGIVNDGLKLYKLARDELGDARLVPQQTLQGSLCLPRWMAQRALRFAVLAKRGKVRDDVLSGWKIARIVSMAKLAAAFVNMACRTMGLDRRTHISNHDRLIKLLQAPMDEGRFVLNPDPVRDEVSIALELKSKSSELGTSKAKDDSTEKRQREADLYRMALPLCGWAKEQRSAGGRTVWKDPRECCMCHVCGDDDAGYTSDDVPEQDETKKQLDLPPLGRLLPMADSGLWVHTACALWSSEVYEDSRNGLLHAVEKARSRGAQLRCFGCGHYGATVGCNKGNCPFNYHFQCAKACGAVFTTNQELFCANHVSCASSVLPRASIEHMKALMVAPEKKIGVEKDTSDRIDPGFCSRLGSLTVHAVGKIETTVDGFHTADYITPPGYVATRIYWSTRHPRTRTLYVLRVERSSDNRADFSILPGDDPASEIRGSSVAQVFSTLLDRVRKVNAKHFSQGDLFSKLPVLRRTRKKTFGLNGPQFFGFGLDHIRKVLEHLPGIEAVVAPLASNSPKYKFCYKLPSTETVLDLQRKRAAAKAEKALENTSGCARTEGIKAVTRSGGSGRITRALVRSAEEDTAGTDAANSTSAKSKGGDAEAKIKANRNLMQMKYKRMKSIPMEQRLIARRSHIHGYGLFTRLDIQKDDAIVEYMGEIICQTVADKRERQYEISGEGSCYMFRLDLHRIVDATSIGCMARFMNHSCQSNAYAKIITVDTSEATGSSGTERKIVIFANRNITAGEEITYDYKFPVEDGSLKCKCGAPNCIGRLN